MKFTLLLIGGKGERLIMSYMFQYLQNVINKTSEFKEKQKKKYFEIFFTFRKKKQNKKLRKNSYFSLHDNIIHKILNK